MAGTRLLRNILNYNGYPPPLKGFYQLLWPGWRSILNARKTSHAKERIRLVFFGCLAMGFMLLSGLGAHWLFSQFLQAEFLADLLIRRTLDIILVFFFGLLLFSNLIAGFTTLLLAPDLPLLMSSPIPAGRLFLGRLVATWGQSSWMVLVFGIPVFAALGPVLDAPWWFYGCIPLILLPYTIICTGLGCTITLCLATWLPAKRTRDILVVLSVLGFLLLYVAFRLAEPEKFLKPDGFEDLISLITSLNSGENFALPTSWALNGFLTQSKGLFMDSLAPIITLYLGAMVTVALGAWLARLVYLRAYDVAQIGRRPSLRAGRTPNPRFPWLNARYPAGPIAALVSRDRRLFFRTTSQWTQLLLVGALVVVYLFNFKHFRSLQDAKIINAMGIFYVNYGLSGLVVTTLAVRFLFPAVSLEGAAFWAVRVAPISAKVLLRSKVRWGLVPLATLSGMLAFGSGWITDLPWWMVISSIGLAILSTIALIGLAVGLGGLWPQFHLDNPTRIASSVGGVFFMLLGATLLIAMALLSGPLMVTLRAYVNSGYIPRPGRLAWIASTGLMGLLLAFAAYKVPLRMGANHLDSGD
jgi:ABC-2 type transport system permease protein